MPISSGSSEEIISTATPSFASLRIRSWMPAFAPTSMPRVGSSKIRICGWVLSHFASTTFCWLPPDRNRTSCSGPWALSSVTAASSLLLMMPGVERRLRGDITVRTASIMLSAIDCASASPSTLRSSVMKPRPARIAWRGWRNLLGLPSISTVPLSTGSAPKIARATSVRPEPTRPASPTISPARTSKLTSRSSGVVRPLTESRTSPRSSLVPRSGK